MREWYFNFLLVKLLLHQLGKRVSQIEIVLALTERARDDIDGRFTKCIHFNEGRRFAQHVFMRIEYFLDCSLGFIDVRIISCLLYTSPSPRDLSTSRMPSSA